MARNDVYDNIADVNNQIDRNNFDLSEATNLTTSIGRLTPCYCRLMPPNSSLQITTRMALKMMPFAYDLQNRINARISFFKVPIRTLWEDYEDFIGNFRNDLVAPFIDFKNRAMIDNLLTVSSLGDYLGVPPYETVKYYTTYVYNILSGRYFLGPSYDSLNKPFPTSAIVPAGQYIFFETTGARPVIYQDDKGYFIYLKNEGASTTLMFPSLGLYDKNQNKLIESSFVYVADNPSQSEYKIYVPNWERYIVWQDSIYTLSMDYSCYRGFYNRFNSSQTLQLPANYKPHFGFLSTTPIAGGFIPFYDSTSDTGQRKLKISAYPFRAYESIYNAYYRDMRNNPYYVDGKVQYNRWIPSRKGGADSYEYKLHYANWERDFLTTAQFTPQQGDPNRPPLVGITTYETLQVNDDGSQTVKTNAAIVDEDGKKYGLQFTSDEDGLTDVTYTRLEDNLSVKSARSLFDVATSGISIADLRNVNAYQKFLELNMRKGYSYKDIIEGRFDVKVNYDSLLMPEFIGSLYQDWETMAITQTVDQTAQGSGDYSKVLGSQAGIAQAYGRSEGINVFCDEECLIMAILVVSPSPVYSSLLPKHFLYRDLLDSYSPEFNHLGFQPIYNKEVNPYTSVADKTENEVFGYQRPWYEYVSSYDTVKGLYRTQLKDFLMQREFLTTPKLSQTFLTINPSDVNNVFTVTDVSDKIFGQIAFDVSAKLPISRISIPRLD